MLTRCEGIMWEVCEGFGAHIRYLWGEHFWPPSYFAGSCGGAPLSIIQEHTEQPRRPS
jgi:putative transposase